MFFVLNRVSVSNPQRLTDYPDHLYLNIGQLPPSPVSSERVFKSAGLLVCRSAGLRSASLQSAFVAHRFLGNQNKNAIVKSSLKNNVKARFVWFYPVSHYRHPCLRVEIFMLK